MTATTAPVRSAPRAGQTVPLGLARLLRVELRRNPMPLVLPLIALVFWFDSYRIAATLPPLWAERLFYIYGQGHSLIDFAPFVAGVAAWMGSRDGRRGHGHLGDFLLPCQAPHQVGNALLHGERRILKGKIRRIGGASEKTQKHRGQCPFFRKSSHSWPLH